MLIFPAIDLFQGQAVRLLRGDYNAMTVYDSDPVNTAMKFKAAGAEWVHVVDLEGAKTGEALNLGTIIKIHDTCGLKCEVGGGIRSLALIERYVNAGIDRVILGTAVVTEKNFVDEAVKNFGEKISVGVDIRDGRVAIKGWQETADIDALEFCGRMQDKGVAHIICTDISKDGAMNGTNLSLYEKLTSRLALKITASGGVSDIDDVKRLAELKLYGAIIGRAYYTGAVNLQEAIREAQK